MNHANEIDNTGNDTTQLTNDRLLIMKHQEDKIYFKQKVALPTVDEDAPDASCRSKMFQWFMEIVEYFKYDNEIVEITLNYLDRCECTDRREYQRICMTALYTAVKIHERTALHPKLVASLSHGQFDAKDIIEYERKLLEQLQWRLHPPTTMAFVRELLPYVPSDVRNVVYDMTQVQLQQTMRVATFRMIPTYILCYAALMNALEIINVPSIEWLGYELAMALNIDCNDKVVMETQAHLYQCILGNPMAIAACRKRSIRERIGRSSHLSTAAAKTVTGVSPRTLLTTTV